MNNHSGDVNIQRILSGTRKLSSLPTVYIKVNELLNDPRSRAVDFGKVISTDQALTARLLKLVNSAFYGFPRKISNVSEAVPIIGFKKLSELVLATSVLDIFKGMGENISFTNEDFWKHSLGCGIACRILAIYKREKNPETYFVAGLLHDIGRLVLLESAPEQYRKVFDIVREKNSLMYEAEKEIFGFSHEDVGKALMTLWKLPSNLEESLGFHHAPREGRASSAFTDTVHLANILVHSAGIGANGEKFIPPLDPDAWKRLDLKKSLLEPALEKIFEQLEETLSFFLGDKKKIS